MSEIARRQNRNIPNATQQLGAVKEEDRSDQIPNDAIEQCRQRIATVENKGGGAIRMSGDFLEGRGRSFGQTQWYNFCKKAWGERTTTRTNKSNTSVQARVRKSQRNEDHVATSSEMKWGSIWDF